MVGAQTSSAIGLLADLSDDDNLFSAGLLVLPGQRHHLADVAVEAEPVIVHVRDAGSRRSLLSDKRRR